MTRITCSVDIVSDLLDREQSLNVTLIFPQCSGLPITFPVKCIFFQITRGELAAWFRHPREGFLVTGALVPKQSLPFSDIFQTTLNRFRDREQGESG